jgi:hypothetical protein
MPSEEPYVRLLPIETRKREDSIASLKQHSIEWVKIKLNLQSHEEMARRWPASPKTKPVRVEEAPRWAARSEGFRHHDRGHAGSKVEIPAWRHAHDQLPASAAEERPGRSRTPGLERTGHRA